MLYTYSIPSCCAFHRVHGMCYMSVPTYMTQYPCIAHFIGSMKCTIYIHICWYLHVAHFVGVMKCTVEAFKTCSNQGLTPTYLQKVGSIMALRNFRHCPLRVQEYHSRQNICHYINLILYKPATCIYAGRKGEENVCKRISSVQRV